MRPRWLHRVYSLSVLFGGLLCIAAYCFFVSRHRILWSDELFGWMLITDPSLHHMLFAWQQGADGGGIAFYLLARLWLHLFGHTVLSFRAFSAAGCYVAFAALWFALRRFYAPGVTAAALFAVWFGSTTILWQMIQTRFYGLLLAATALALLASVCSAEIADAEPAATQKARGYTLAFTAASNLLLAATHPFGVLYSAAILAGSAVSDKLHHRRRPWFYLAASLPWTVLIASRTAILNSSKVGKPHFWTTRPDIHALIAMYKPQPLGWTLLLLLLVLFGLACLRTLPLRVAEAVRQRSLILLPAAALTLVPIAIFITSQRGTSLFVNRYLISFTIGVAVLLAEALAMLSSASIASSSPLTRAAAPLTIGILLLATAHYALVRYPRTIYVPFHDFTPSLAAQLPPGLPVVIERPDLFDVMLAQQRSTTFQPLYLLDWDVAVAPQTLRGLASGYHEMQNWQRIGYFSGSILQYRQFLRTHDTFVVLSDPTIQWVNWRILSSAQWHARPIGTFRCEAFPSTTIWLVQRTHPD